MGIAPCCDKNGLKKGPWTAEEDQKLLDYIQKNGYGNWRTLPKNTGLERCGKNCRLRWTNYLRPDIKRGRFSFEEEETIIQLHSVLGNTWSAIAARLPGRTDNEIKNYWNIHIRKRLLRMGIDPVTHNPRLDLLDLSSFLYNSCQIKNISWLLGFQPHTNLLRLATTLLSSSQNTNLLLQNVQEVSQLVTLENQVQNQLLPLLQNTLIEEIPFTSDHQAQLTHPNDFEQFTDFNSQDCQILNNWQCSDLPSDVTNDQFVPLQNHYLCGSDDQSMLESYGFQTNNFSTLTSTSNSLSNSTYINSSSTCTEDEKESYGSSMMKFEIPDALGIDCFM